VDEIIIKIIIIKKKIINNNKIIIIIIIIIIYNFLHYQKKFRSEWVKKIIKKILIKVQMWNKISHALTIAKNNYNDANMCA